MTELDGSVLDILIYVFDRYMLDDGQDVPERDELAQNLEEVGFEGVKVERALGSPISPANAIAPNSPRPARVRCGSSPMPNSRICRPIAAAIF